MLAPWPFRTTTRRGLSPAFRHTQHACPHTRDAQGHGQMQIRPSDNRDNAGPGEVRGEGIDLDPPWPFGNQPAERSDLRFNLLRALCPRADRRAHSRRPGTMTGTAAG